MRTGMVALVVLILVAVSVAESVVSHSSLVIGPVVTVVLLVIARRSGLSWDQLGLGRSTWGTGARWALVGIAAVLAVYVAAAAFPPTRSAFDDARYQESYGAALLTAFVVIPLSTVLLEEVAFRGVLWGALREDRGVVVATVGSSLLFGLWHVLPSVNLSENNAAVENTLGASSSGRILTVAGAVAFTALAGVLFCELRRRSGSLLAPAGLHWATNAIGVLVTSFLWHLTGG